MSWENKDPAFGRGGRGNLNAFDDDQFGNNDFSHSDIGHTGADGDFAGGNGHGGRPLGACYNCGQEGHNKADCPNPQVIRCHHCNEEGHTQRDCPDPNKPIAEFTGECRLCGTQGHRAAQCPDKGPVVCNNCKQEGHFAHECENPRAIDRSNVETVDSDEAWNMVKNAVLSVDKDIDDIKDAIQKYVKAAPDTTYINLETIFRRLDWPLYLIAVEKPAMLSALTNMDFQGNLNKKYQVSYRFDPRDPKSTLPREAPFFPKPARAREAPFFPKGLEDNMKRLEDAGEPVDRGLMKCNNCDQYGHTARGCPEEKVEIDRVAVKCFNCGEAGHRVRDCPTPRIDKFACRNCNQPGHKVQDCPEPPNPANVECRKCGEMGHFSRDCPQGGGGGGGACHNCGEEGHRAKDCTEPKKIICRNCDAEGHTGRDCPKPRDYSRVKCQNCGEMGHTKVRCKQPFPTDPDAVDEADTNGAAEYGAVETSLANDDGFGGNQQAGNFGAAPDVDNAW